MGKKTLDADPFFGTTFIDNDKSINKLHVGTFQDVQPLLERNKIYRNDEDRTKAGIKNGWFHVASFPPAAIAMIEKQYGLKPGGFLTLKDDKLLNRIINDRDLSGFKTTTKRV